MAKYLCNHCGVIVNIRKRRGLPLKKWIKSICGNNNNKTVRIILQEGGKHVKRRRSKN